MQRYALLNTSTHKLEITEMKNSILTGSECFTFHQDNAPAHRARETVEFLSRNTPDFMAPSLWPPNSPGLKPRWLSSLECAPATRLPEQDSRGTAEKKLWSKSGAVSHSASLTMPSSNGVFDWGHVFVKTMATLRTNCLPNCESNRCCEWRPYWKR